MQLFGSDLVAGLSLIENRGLNPHPEDKDLNLTAVWTVRGSNSIAVVWKHSSQNDPCSELEVLAYGPDEVRVQTTMKFEAKVSMEFHLLNFTDVDLMTLCNYPNQYRR